MKNGPDYVIWDLRTKYRLNVQHRVNLYECVRYAEQGPENSDMFEVTEQILYLGLGLCESIRRNGATILPSIPYQLMSAHAR